MRLTSCVFQVGGLGGGRSKGANGSSQVSGGGQSSQPGRSTSSNKSNGTTRARPGRSASELTVPPGQVEDF